MNHDDTTEKGKTTYYKVFNKKEYHNGLQYRDGINEDPIPFNPDSSPDGSCLLGGMYYSDIKNILAFLSFGPWLREVVLLEDSQIYENPKEDPESWKTDKFILKPRIRINAALVKKLIDEGADVHVGRGQALIGASADNHLGIVKVLLGNGADVNVEEGGPLEWAANNGHLKIVEFLLKKGADIHAQRDKAIKRACINNHLEIVEFLLENGADVNAMDEDYFFWRYGNHIKITKVLLKNGAKSW